MICIMILMMFKIITIFRIILLSNQNLNLFGYIYHAFYGLMNYILKIKSYKLLKDSKILKKVDLKILVLFVKHVNKYILEFGICTKCSNENCEILFHVECARRNKNYLQYNNE